MACAISSPKVGSLLSSGYYVPSIIVFSVFMSSMRFGEKPD